MYQNEFLPVVFNIQLRSTTALSIERWRSQIYELLHIYVDEICKDENLMIGHIKALAQINELDFIKYSCISCSSGINSQVQGNNQNNDRINLTINSLVSDISEKESRIIIKKSCEIFKKQIPMITIQIEHKDQQLETSHHMNDEKCQDCEEYHH